MNDITSIAPKDRPFPHRPCEWCGTIFEAKYCTSRFCTKACSNHTGYVANPEKYSEASRKSRAANPEKYREYQRKYRADNPEKYSEGRAKNREKRLEYDRKRYADNPEKHLEADRKRYADNPEKRIEISRYSARKTSAKKLANQVLYQLSELQKSEPEIFNKQGSLNHANQ